MHGLRAFFANVAAVATASVIALTPGAVLAKIDVPIGVYRTDELRDPPLSRLDYPPEDLAFAGAQLGIADNQTTGSFLGMNFSAKTFAGDDAALREAVRQDYADGIRYFVLNAAATTQTALADAMPDALFFNASEGDNGLRGGECRANLLHSVPSYAMRTDALVQYLIWKKWNEAVLIYGSHDADRALAESYRASAKKFGVEIVEELLFEDTGGARRSDTGIALVQKQIPLFTQKIEDHDVIIAADESDVFGAFLPYRTWTPRPVTGSAGLRPVTWMASMENWGGTQLQTRFEKAHTRFMQELDYQNWLAIRAIGEAVVRSNTAEVPAIRDYLLGDQFKLAGFKGTPLNFRNWNGQMRQPILLSDLYLTVSVSPQEGYLHEFSVLDTLGIDRSESACNVF